MKVFIASLTLIAVLAYVILVYITRRGFSFRNTGMPLLLIAFAFSFIALLDGKGVTISRNIVLVASCSTSAVKVQEAASNIYSPREFSYFSPSDSISIMVFTNSFENNGNDSALERCENHYDSIENARVLNLQNLPNPQYDEVPLRLFYEASKLASFQWSSVLKSIKSLFLRPTIILLFDSNDPAWSTHFSGQLNDGLISPSSNILKGMDVYVIEPENNSPMIDFNIDLEGKIYAGRRLENIGSILDLYINDAGRIFGNEVEISVCITLNEDVDWDSCVSSDNTSTDNPKPRIYFNALTLKRVADDPSTLRWFTESLIDSESNLPVINQEPLFRELIYESNDFTEAARFFRNQIVTSGWQALQFKARIAGGPHAGLELTNNVVHFNVEDVKPMVVFGHNHKFLASWQQNPKSGTIKKQFSRVWGGDPLSIFSQTDMQFSALQKPSSECIIEDPLPDEDVLFRCLDESQSLLLIEPTTEQLKTLTESGIINGFLQKGGSILVAAPPALDEVQDELIVRWLPAYTGITKSDEISYLSRQLFFVGDCSLIPHQPIKPGALPALNKDELRKIDIQKVLVDKIVMTLASSLEAKSFNISNVTNFGPQLIRLEPRQPLNPSITLNSRAGCIFPKISSLPTVSDLISSTHPETRINTFVRGQNYNDAKPFLALNENSLYPGSLIVLISGKYVEKELTPGLQINRILGNNINAVDDDATGKVNGTISSNLITQLENQGVKIISIEIVGGERFYPSDTEFLDIAETTESWARRHGITHKKLRDITKIEDFASAVLETITEHITSSNQNQHVVDHGRILDPRVDFIPKGMPLVWQTLDKVNEVFARKHVILQGNEKPMVVSGRVSNGRVIVLSYNPFVGDVWDLDFVRSDTLSAQHNDNIEEDTATKNAIIHRSSELSREVMFIQGMGPFRMVDALLLSSTNLPVESEVKLLSIEVTPEGQTAIFTVQLPNNMQQFQTPRIEFPITDVSRHCQISDTSDPSCPLRLHNINPINKTAKYLFSTSDSDGLPFSFYTLHLDRNVDVPLWLNQKQATFGNPKDRVLNFLAIIGGKEVLLRPPRPQADISKVVALIMLFCVGVLFSTLISSWAGFQRWSKNLDAKNEEIHLKFDSDLLFQRLSNIIANYESTRRAGVPAWMRRFGPGDSLSQAITLDLTPFSNIGHELNLPLHPPRVRLKETELGFEILFLIEDSVSMNFPGDKIGRSRKKLLLVALIDILARTASEHGGLCLLKGVRNDEIIRTNKGRAKSIVSEAITTWINQGKGQPKNYEISQFTNSEVIYITDAMSLSISEILELNQTKEVSVIVLRDPEQVHETGIGFGGDSNSIYDRTDWNIKDYERLAAEYYKNIYETLEVARIPIAIISTEDPEQILADKLSESGILEKSLRL